MFKLLDTIASLGEFILILIFKLNKRSQTFPKMNVIAQYDSRPRPYRKIRIQALWLKSYFKL